MPSEKVLASKKAIVAELAEKLKNAKSGVIVEYKGITVAQDTQLRKNFRAANVEYSVVKNTLLRFAAQEAGLEGITGSLEGTTALAISNDELTAPAKIFCDFAKDKENLQPKCGFVEGDILDKAGVEALSKIPSKEILIATVLGTFNAPIAALARCINAIAEQKESA